MLAPQGRAEVLEVVRTLNRRDGITIVLISHAMEDLADAERIIALDAGRIALDGPAARVFDQLSEAPLGPLAPPAGAGGSRLAWCSSFPSTSSLKRPSAVILPTAPAIWGLARRPWPSGSTRRCTWSGWTRPALASARHSRCPAARCGGGARPGGGGGGPR